MQPTQHSKFPLIGKHGHEISVKGHPVEVDRWFVINFDRILKAKATVFLGLNLIKEPFQILHPPLSRGRQNLKPNYVTFAKTYHIIANGLQISREVHRDLSLLAHANGHRFIMSLLMKLCTLHTVRSQVANSIAYFKDLKLPYRSHTQCFCLSVSLAETLCIL